MIQICSICEKKLSKPFEVTVYENDGGETDLKNEYPPEGIRGVAVYRHKKCPIYGGGVKNPGRKKFSNIPYSSALSGDSCYNGLRIKMDGGRYMMVVPSSMAIEKK